MAGRIDGKEWMGDVDVDEDLRDGLTDKKGGSWGVSMYGYATRPGGLAVLGAWVCVCVMILQLEPNKPSINPSGSSNISNAAKAGWA